MKGYQNKTPEIGLKSPKAEMVSSEKQVCKQFLSLINQDKGSSSFNSQLLSTLFPNRDQDSKERSRSPYRERSSKSIVLFLLDSFRNEEEFKTHTGDALK